MVKYLKNLSPSSSIFKFQNPLHVLYKEVVYYNKINKTTCIISAARAYMSPISEHIALDFLRFMTLEYISIIYSRM